ncbi:hypothetical protein ABW19_dt0201922 [Dactylella cylindrospora]|nr:hypothetical protein ABW19_dt0201922 [Dactylella cylindrospora]
MSFQDDDYGDDLDDDLLIAATQQYEEQAASNQKATPTLHSSKSSVKQTPRPAAQEEDYGDLLENIFSSDIIDEEDDFRALPSRNNAPSNLRQRTLFGDLADEDESNETTHRGWRLMNHNEAPTHHKIDKEAAKTWIYPTNVSHRDYQFNITKRALFTNVLVALPTGLGKTFIAATVMYNWYRWAPQSQIIFMAPTKPLVAQQVDACHKIVGIPKRETCLLTGNVSPGHRADYWNEKRVFFLTPQTLETDLTSGRCDPKKIVLIVVDEAHRATGEYAYCKVLRHIRRFNQSFRVMALTATPGSKVESVQAVITSLGIARTEIRTEESLDIREYINHREIQVEKFPLTDEITLIRDQFGNALKPLLKKLNEQRACYITDPTNLTAFSLTQARQQFMNSPAAQSMGWPQKGAINGIFTALSSLAYAFELLLYHGIRPFYDYIREYQMEQSTKPTGGGKMVSNFLQDKQFLSMMNRCRALMNENEFLGHPKLDYLCGTVLKYFAEAKERGEDDTKVMVFSNYRKSGDEIFRVLKKHQPMIKPTLFVGQSSGKTGDGMSQKEQQDTIERFKKGEFNVLVATSIGEEGLDIGEVDFIVCFDASASPIRMLQRMGRTGRKRAGAVVVLVTEGKEEAKWEKAQDNYRWMQNAITQGNTFKYDKEISPRILPGDIETQCVKMAIEITPESGETSPPSKRRGKKKAPPKKWHMPDGVETGFTTAAALGGFAPASKKTKRSKAKDVVDEPQILLSDADEDFRMLEEPQEDVFPDPAPASYFLSQKQERELQTRYQSFYGNDDEGVIVAPRMDAFPNLQRKLQPTRLVGHSRSTKSMVSLLQKMRTMTNHDIERLQNNLDIEDIASSTKKGSPARNSAVSQSTLNKLKAFKAPSRTTEKVPTATALQPSKMKGPNVTPKSSSIVGSKNRESVDLLSPPPTKSKRDPSDLFSLSDESEEEFPSVSQTMRDAAAKLGQRKENVPAKRKAEAEPVKQTKRAFSGQY